MDRGEIPHLINAQFESVRKMAGIFGGDVLQSLTAATLAEQRFTTRSTRMSEGSLLTYRCYRPPVAELKPAQCKPLRLNVNPYQGKEGENLHFWFREVELAMDAALISTERLRVAFALSNLGGRAKTWAYIREATTLGCFTIWAQLCQQFRAAFLPANYEYHQRSRFLACKQGKRELYEYTQEMRVLAASLVENPLPERIKVTVFMDGLKVGPSRTQLFRVNANTMDEAIQISLQEEGRPTGEDLSLRGRSEVGAHHEGLAPESLGALETRKSSGGLLVVPASVRGYGDPFRILIDSGESTIFTRRQTVARNGDKYACKLCVKAKAGARSW
ncbi:Gag protein [Phytophthora palmivora]|uniref:Gag protein n=1 Tax=Phytophthora palmivora TaxID=4796 RepID=A0A2P4YFB6_9STRA|nr:Gag protein [Phytophthora palmivora]